jgi:hypothetical protein
VPQSLRLTAHRSPSELIMGLWAVLPQHAAAAGGGPVGARLKHAALAQEREEAVDRERRVLGAEDHVR